MGDAPMPRLFFVTAYNLYLMTLVGNPAPVVEATGKWMRDPRLGDLVMETSTIWNAERDAERFGRLVRVSLDPVWTPEEWAASGEDASTPIPTHRVWYVALPDGREYRWHNASFIAIPPDIHAFDGTRPASPEPSHD